MTGAGPDQAATGAGDDVDDESAVDVDPTGAATTMSFDASTASPADEVSSRIEELDAEAVPWERIDWIACAVLVLASLVLVGLHVRTYTTLSPTDELQHLDYVIKAGEFDPPLRNEFVGQEAMAEAACRGVDVFGYIGPQCGLDVHDPENFQERGVNTAATQFPPYYTVTGLFSRALTDTGVLDSTVTAARLAGALWAGAAWAVLWFAMSLLGISRQRRTVAIVAFMATPLVLFHAATINADSALLLTGSLILLAALQFERGRLHGAWLLAAFIGLYFVEATNALPIAAASSYLVVRTFRETDIALWKRLLPVAGIVIAVMLRLEVANVVRDALFPAADFQVVPTMFEDRPTRAEYRLDWGFVFDQLGSTFTPLKRTYLQPQLRTEPTRILLALTDWLAIGALLAVALFLPMRDRRITRLAQVGVPALLLAGPFYSWTFAYFSAVEFPAQGRFGLPLIPIIVVVLAAAMRSRRAFVVGAVIAAVSMLNTVLLVLT